MHSSAGVRAAIPRDSRINCDGTEKGAYAVSPTVEPYGIEWIRSDLGEISKFVNGIIGGKSAATTHNQRVNARRCYKTSISSGYSSHSPLLSVGSCSYRASTSTRDLSYGGLAVIHESETACVPQPIWPFVACYQAENIDYEGIYTCRVCGCTCSYSPPSSPSASSPLRASAREMLLELSRTLNSMIDGDIAVAPQDILRDISRIVSLEIDPRSDNLYECVCPSWTFNDDNLSVSPSYIKHVPPRANSVHSKLYVGPRAFYENNSMRSALLLKNDKITRRENAEREFCETSSGPYVFKYLNDKHVRSGCAKLSFGLDKDKQCQNGLTSTESKYSTQLDYSDIGSSSEETIASSNDWNRRLAVKGLEKDLDFTLDVTRAERLNRTIAKAKRKRQWCRAFITLFALIFFVLSVIVVSLCITRGRKMFGSI
ncbi:uncharacterized protein LOC115236771 isoform X1 [Formica exsecta]|uniref:uncharacterized protein LOC115236771 isoform X1 n=1 Tax=Formica exsecta TaxID=72781 RepID=UPI001141737F|nr:uncharacterized protein LOC115236771 isoform X1 [Formica exsecta]XP_029665312.1 uncharacterized protein LOC115236771 isoform X1 [Formica exsecta]XP_029665313.1 uncharacterized protein LOC115236771 isoform X1 [Formica exsecta]XP_029665314.1 uncharacterized protein LOC115236771 isoform X1 [Formica exsecta]XP_029665315.1 uncharacterized protein LOC115236771 isoform X1 [Formica exsecta]